MRTTELPVASVDNAGEFKAMNYYSILMDVVEYSIDFSGRLTQGGWV